MVKAVIFDMYETLITHYKCPLYFSEEMARDVSTDCTKFKRLWRSTDYERTVGLMTFDDAIKDILVECGCYTKENLEKIVRNRIKTKEECFRTMDEEIIPMMEALKQRGVKIGLISNCFSEEAKVIRESVLMKYFDACILSCEKGTRKPEEKIFDICLGELGVKAEECIYVGDGGSDELRAAKNKGMRAVQAVWYLKDGTFQPTSRMSEYEQSETPLEIINILDNKK